MRNKTFDRYCALFTTSLALGGCAFDPATPEDLLEEEVAGTQEAISVERTGGIAEVVASRYLFDGDVASTSYASPAVFTGGDSAPTCSGAMIGPNVLMTAAHCGIRDSIKIEFRGYADANRTRPFVDAFRCSYMLQTFDKTDLVLYWCAPNGADNPGDVYGYLDFETRAPAIGDDVYSLWTNPVGSTGTHLLYSEGEVTSVTHTGWFTEGTATGTTTSTWSDHGSSGSPQLDANTHRILIGPTSTGTADGSGRNALSIARYFSRGSVDSDAADINSTLLTSLGLTPASYRGSVDEDRDQLFDVVEDAERYAGENAKRQFYLGFDSARRRAFWTHGGDVTIDPTFAYAHIERPVDPFRPGQAVVLRYDRLSLAAGRTYRVSFYSAPISPPNAAAMNVVLINRAGSVVARTPVATPITSIVPRAVVITNPTSAPATLGFEAYSGYVGNIRDVAVLENGTALDFDSYDDRLGWTDASRGGRAITIPESARDWAGVADRPGPSTVTSYTLRRNVVPIQSGVLSRICFDARSIGSTPSGNFAAARVTVGTGTVTSMTFRPGATYATFCTPDFAPTYAPAFEVGIQPAAGISDYLTVLGARVAIDNVRIELRR